MDETSKLTEFTVYEISVIFELKFKNYIMVTDNAIAMKSAFTDIEWIGCGSHNINLAQKHGFEVCGEIKTINALLENCKNLVKWAKQSGHQKELDTTLKQMIEVRWDSKYDMISSILQNYDKLETMSGENQRLFELMEKIN